MGAVCRTPLSLALVIAVISGAHVTAEEPEPAGVTAEGESGDSGQTA